MTFEMESEKHAINMTYDRVHGLTIIGLKCPNEEAVMELLVAESKLSAVGEWFNKTRFKRGQISNDAWIKLYKILEDIPKDDIIIPIINRNSEFKEDSDK